jgi:hypothetical protein
MQKCICTLTSEISVAFEKYVSSKHTLISEKTISFHSHENHISFQLHETLKKGKIYRIKINKYISEQTEYIA